MDAEVVNMKLFLQLLFAVLITAVIVGTYAKKNAIEKYSPANVENLQIGEMPGTWLVELKSGQMYEAQIRCVPKGVFVTQAAGDILIPGKQIKSMRRVDIDASENSARDGSDILRLPGNIK